MTEARARTPSDIVIVGDGVDAWMAAAFFARKLQGDARKIRVCPTARAAPQSLSALLLDPGLCALHAELGINERDIVRFCSATFSLGLRYENWGAQGADFATPYGECGAAINTIAFHHYWLRNHRRIEATRFDDYSIAATAGRAGKFSHPVADVSSILSTYRYGLHVDAERYRDYLQKYALHCGAVSAPRTYDRVAFDPGTGTASAVVLSNGGALFAGLIIDATGADALVITQADGSSSWRTYPRCSTLGGARLARAETSMSPSLTRIVADKTGWRMDIPLQDAVYSVIGASDEGEQAGGMSLELGALGRRDPWVDGIIAIGDAACRLDPLATPGPSLTAEGLRHLLKLLPASAIAPERAEYNRIMNSVFDRRRDFQCFQYWLAERGADCQWARGAAEAATPHLQRKIEQFLSRGRIVQYDDETIDEAMWVASFIGAGAHPERHDPLCDLVTAEDVTRKLSLIRQAVAKGARAMPHQLDYLRGANALSTPRQGP